MAISHKKSSNKCLFYIFIFLLIINIFFGLHTTNKTAESNIKALLLSSKLNSSLQLLHSLHSEIDVLHQQKKYKSNHLRGEKAHLGKNISLYIKNNNFVSEKKVAVVDTLIIPINKSVLEPVSIHPQHNFVKVIADSQAWHSITEIMLPKHVNISTRSSWHKKILNKIKCLRLKKMAYYLYHVRKAAGTTIREILAFSAHSWNSPLHETEGISLDETFLDFEDHVSVMALRHPVARVKSLYWYEHVGWWYGIVKEMDKCKPFRTWADAWRDGSSWKNKFMHKNPGSVYVEVENYYVKLLTGWRSGPVTESHLERAKRVLTRFDVVLISEKLNEDRTREAMNTFFQVKVPEVLHMLQGDSEMKKQLQNTLAPDEDDVMRLLADINSLDLRLWQFANELVAARMGAVRDLAEDLRLDGSTPTCPARRQLSSRHKMQLGIHRPPGHKGPLSHR